MLGWESGHSYDHGQGKFAGGGGSRKAISKQTNKIRSAEKDRKMEQRKEQRERKGNNLQAQ